MCCNTEPNKASSQVSSAARLRGLQTDLHLQGTHCWIHVLSHLFNYYEQVKILLLFYQYCMLGISSCRYHREYRLNLASILSIYL